MSSAVGPQKKPTELLAEWRALPASHRDVSAPIIMMPLVDATKPHETATAWQPSTPLLPPSYCHLAWQCQLSLAFGLSPCPDKQHATCTFQANSAQRPLTACTQRQKQLCQPHSQRHFKSLTAPILACRCAAERPSGLISAKRHRGCCSTHHRAFGQMEVHFRSAAAEGSFGSE